MRLFSRLFSQSNAKIRFSYCAALYNRCCQLKIVIIRYCEGQHFLLIDKTAPDVFREPEEDEDPLLELLQTQSSFDTEQETGPDRPQQDRKRAIQRLSQAAERASSWLWLRREEMSWKQSTNAQ